MWRVTILCFMKFLLFYTTHHPLVLWTNPKKVDNRKCQNLKLLPQTSFDLLNDRERPKWESKKNIMVLLLIIERGLLALRILSFFRRCDPFHMIFCFFCFYLSAIKDIWHINHTFLSNSFFVYLEGLDGVDEKKSMYQGHFLPNWASFEM